MTQFPPSQPPRRRRLVAKDSGADQPTTVPGSQGGAGAPARRNSGSSRVNPKSTRSGSGAPAQPISTRSAAGEAERATGSAQARPSSRVGRSGGAVPLPSDAPAARSATQVGRGGAPTRTALRDSGAQPFSPTGANLNSRASSRPVMPTRLPVDEPPASSGRKKRRWLKYTCALLVVVLITLCGYTWHLWNKASDQLRRVDALSSMADTPGETWLIVGSDSRSDGAIADTTTSGQRADSVMVLHKAENGQTSLTSLPRDTYVNIPGYGEDKINASYAYGGAKLLVKTVEGLTKMKINHYVEVGMGGVKNVVDAVGGVEACLDYDVDDHDSGLIWNTAQGKCQQVNGEKALAFSRMRKSDPTGDIGRGLRQRAIISAAVKKAMSPSTLLNPSATSKLVDAGTGSLTVDKDSGVWDIGQMVLAFRAASNDGLTGAPPIEDPDYEPGGVGSTVLLVDTTAPIFFGKVRDGRLTTSDFNQAK